MNEVMTRQQSTSWAIHPADGQKIADGMLTPRTRAPVLDMVQGALVTQELSADTTVHAVPGIYLFAHPLGNRQGLSGGVSLRSYRHRAGTPTA